jgi:hypothetical protein
MLTKPIKFHPNDVCHTCPDQLWKKNNVIRLRIDAGNCRWIRNKKNIPGLGLNRIESSPRPVNETLCVCRTGRIIRYRPGAREWGSPCAVRRTHPRFHIFVPPGFRFRDNIKQEVVTCYQVIPICYEVNARLILDTAVKPWFDKARVSKV